MQNIIQCFKKMKLSECFTFLVGGDVDKLCFSETKDDMHPYPIYANALTNKGLYGYSSKYKIKDECITITGRGDIGNVFYRKGFFTPIVRLIVAIPRENINAKFMSYACSKIRFFNETTGVPQLTVPQVQGHKVLVPPLAEQEKIAEILGAWDSAIEKLTALIAAKRLQKKGMMQKLLTARIRLPGFTDEWKPLEFKDISSLIKEKYSPVSSEHHKCVELEHIEPNTARLLGYVDSSEQNSIKNKFYKKDIIFGKLRPYLKKFYKASFDGVCSTEFWVLRGKNEICLTDFLYWIIQTPKFNAVCNVASGTHMPRADWSYVSEIPFSIPTDISEQKAIADILSKADEEIDLLTRKLDLIQSQKKGLMQQLLTGKIRVKVV